MSDPQEKLQKLRGSLPAEEPGARGMEHMARNTNCLRLSALTIAGVNPATASQQVYDTPVREGLSPFAIRRGERFEAALFEDGCKRMFDLYGRANRLPEEQSKWIDMSQKVPGTDNASMQARRQASEQLIQDRAAGKKGLPNIIIKPRLQVQLMGAGRPTEPDALVAADDDLLYRPVEIKSYADRNSMTDASKTGSACRQASVAVIALQQLLGDAIPVPRIVDLIFAKPATNWPTLHVMDVQGEVLNLHNVFSQAPESLQKIEALLAGKSLDSSEGLDLLPNHLCADCADHCPLWDCCRTAAIERGDIGLLGDHAKEMLSGISSIDEAVELQKLGSNDDADLDLLAALLHEADQAHQKVMEDETS